MIYTQRAFYHSLRSWEKHPFSCKSSNRDRKTFLLFLQEIVFLFDISNWPFVHTFAFLHNNENTSCLLIQVQVICHFVIWLLFLIWTNYYTIITIESITHESNVSFQIQQFYSFIKVFCIGLTEWKWFPNNLLYAHKNCYRVMLNHKETKD